MVRFAFAQVGTVQPAPRHTISEYVRFNRPIPGGPFCYGWRMSGGPEILLHIDRSHPETLAGQLRAGIRDAIRSQRLAAGTRLPASRVLAEDLGVSRGVVVDAYAHLVAEGFLVTRPGSGTMVSDAAGITPAHSSWWHRRGQQQHHRLWQPELDLRPSGPDPALFPRPQAARTMTEILRRLPVAELGYTGPWGVATLRRHLESHLSRLRAAMAPADGIVVVTGQTQALTVIARTLAAAGHDHIAVEDPSDPRHRHLLQTHGLKAIPVRVDNEGLDVGALAASGCQAVLTSPSCQFPTGAVMSAARRARLLDWAVAGRALIIEDDQRADFHFERPALACLQGMRPEQVLLIGSVSMTLAPAMRLGWIVPPPRLLRAIAETKRDDDFGSAVMEQHALAAWLESGHYDRHVRRARRSYAMRRAANFPAASPTGTSPPTPGSRGSGSARSAPCGSARPGRRAWCCPTPGWPRGTAPRPSPAWNSPCRPSSPRTAPCRRRPSPPMTSNGT